jgi:hypothetical protein
MNVPDAAHGAGNTAILETIAAEDERVTLVIQAQHENNGGVRIVSAYYETVENVELKYRKHAFNMKNKRVTAYPTLINP